MCLDNGGHYIKNELGWTDHRLTDYTATERCWELVLSAYRMVSLQLPGWTIPGLMEG